MLAVVLNDEETYSPLEGCLLVEVGEDYLDEHDSYEGDGRIVSEFSIEAPYIEFDDEQPADGNVFMVVLADGDIMSPVSGCLVIELPEDYNGIDAVADGTQLAEL